MEYKPEFENSHMAEGGRRLRFFLETCMFTCVFAGESSRCSSRQLSAQDTAEYREERDPEEVLVTDQDPNTTPHLERRGKAS